LSDADLLELFEHGMSGERRAAMEEHIDTCSSCRELVAKMAIASPSSARATVRNGAVALATRFKLDARVGAGAMGEVFLATDTVTGTPVAVKVLHAGAEYDDARFEREARVLAAIAHPSIVRYIAHGETTARERYIAMEWLEGETLAARLKRAPLTIAESIRVARRIADGLSAVHARGVIHRDIKPSNVMLVGGKPERATLIDFGVARVMDASVRTTPGAVLGTPAYMAPEQAQALAVIDARADLFSLGCLLFRCLAGTAAYEGDNVIAILAKVVLQDAPRLRDRAKVPAALDDLVASMMARDPSRRPQSADAVIARLDAIASSGDDLEPLSSMGSVVELGSSLTGREQRVVSLVAIDAPGEELDRDEWQHLADGTCIAVVSDDTAAKDRATRAVRTALALRERSSAPAIVVATGHAFVDGHVAFGDLIDRVSELLRRDRGGAHEGVSVDDATAGLLDAAFEVTRDTSSSRVLREHAGVEPFRVLATKTPFVGREREIEMLDGLLAGCVDEPAARCVVVTGVEGIGKSRLLAEWLVRLENRGVTAWIGRGDASGAGASALVGEMLRRTAGIQLGVPTDEAREKLASRVARSIPSPAARRVTDALAGLAGIDVERASSDQALVAWLDFVDAELSRGPLVVVLEDLHWGDAASLRLCDAALRAFRERPLMVLALGRPEVRQVFPALFEDRDPQWMSLGPLGKRACDALVHDMLSGASVAVATRIVAQAQGSAFMLEELVRAHVDGRGDAIPESVLAIVGSRLARLPEETRLVLRAASVFGASFWRGALRAMLHDAMSSAELSSCLDTLVDKDVIVRRPESRFARETEYAFRHALVRDAAYRMLVAEDLVLAHGVAARWLVRLGERDAAAVAAHYDAALEPSSALAWHRRAAEDAYRAGDLDAALAQSDHAIACGARGEVLGALHLVQARALHARGDLAGQLGRAEHALATLAPGSEPFYEALGLACLACQRMGDADGVRAAAARVLEIAPADGRAEIARAEAGARLYQSLRALGHDGESVLQIMRQAHERHPDSRSLSARLHEAEATAAKYRADIARYVEEMLAALVIRIELDDQKQLVSTHADIGDAWAQLGRYGEALEASNEAAARAERLGMQFMARATQMNIGGILIRLGRLDEARALLERIVADAARSRERHFAHARAYLADVLRRQGQLEAAERVARSALDLGARDEPFAHATTLMLLAEVLLARGAAGEAVATSRAALAVVSEHGFEEGEVRLRLVHGQALFATGDVDDARAQAANAARLVTDAAGRIAHSALRQSFLENVEENARVIAFAHQLEAR
jgi:tetratricopeptide (TPR) repeat protein